MINQYFPTVNCKLYLLLKHLLRGYLWLRCKVPLSEIYSYCYCYFGRSALGEISFKLLQFQMTYDYQSLTITIKRNKFTRKRRFVLLDQVFPLIVVYCLFLLLRNKCSFAPVLSMDRNCPGQFYLLIFYSEKSSTSTWRLAFVVDVNLNLSINSN